jgi:hypothetical protein
VAGAALASLPPVVARAQAVTAEAVVKHYAAGVSAGYEDTLAAALEMQKAIATFVAQPSAESLKAARDAWRAAREWYGPTEAFRFYGGPIDDDQGPEGRLNAWPLDESYVDYVKGKPASGIVGNRKLAITKASLARLNEKGGEENIAAGWHAIEFLLWGQDFNDNGPGDRSFEDYVDGKAPQADRFSALHPLGRALLDDPGAIRKITSASPWRANGRRAARGGDEHAGPGGRAPSDSTHRDVVANATASRARPLRAPRRCSHMSPRPTTGRQDHARSPPRPRPAISHRSTAIVAARLPAASAGRDRRADPAVDTCPGQPRSACAPSRSK